MTVNRCAILLLFSSLSCPHHCKCQSDNLDEGNFEFNTAEIVTTIKIDDSTEVNVEGFKTWGNDYVLQRIEANPWNRGVKSGIGSLRFLSIGYPMLVLPTNVDQTDSKQSTTIPYFAPSARGYTISIGTLTDKIRMGLASAASIQYQLKIGPDQILLLVPTNLTCEMTLSAINKLYSIPGKATELNANPLKVEFQVPLNSVERSLLQSRSLTPNMVSISCLMIKKTQRDATRTTVASTDYRKVFTLELGSTVPSIRATEHTLTSVKSATASAARSIYVYSKATPSPMHSSKVMEKTTMRTSADGTKHSIPPMEVSVTERGSSHLVIKFKGPENYSLDDYNISYRGIHIGSLMDIPLIPASSNTFNLSNGIHPGETYVISVFKVRGSESSAVATITASSRPLPPTSIDIFPDFERLQFRIHVSVEQNELNQFSGCRLEISLPGSLKKANVLMAAAQNKSCDFYAVLSPGDSYSFRSWTLSGQDETSSEVEKRLTTVVQPAFDEGKFGVKLVVSPTTIRVSWASDLVEKLWPSVVGSSGEIIARLNRDSDVDTIGVSPLSADPANSLIFKGLSYGTCYSVQIYATTAGVLSQFATKHIRTAVPETTITLKAIASRFVNLIVGQMSVSNTTLANDADRVAGVPRGNLSKTEVELVSGDSSCRITVQMIADNKSVVASQTLDNLSVKPWAFRFADLQPFRRYVVSAFQQCGGSESGNSQCPFQRTQFCEIEFMTNDEEYPVPIKHYYTKEP